VPHVYRCRGRPKEDTMAGIGIVAVFLMLFVTISKDEE
jgi:hypothetical protein